MIEFNVKDPEKHGEMPRLLAKGKEGDTPNCGTSRRWNPRRKEEGVFVIAAEDAGRTFECILDDDAVVDFLVALKGYCKRDEYKALMLRAGLAPA